MGGRLSMVSFTERRLFGEGAAGSAIDGKGEGMTFAIKVSCLPDFASHKRTIPSSDAGQASFSSLDFRSMFWGGLWAKIPTKPAKRFCRLAGIGRLGSAINAARIGNE